MVSRANYLDNAIKHAARQPHHPACLHGTTCSIEVIDDGPGVAIEAQSRLFSFYRANDESTPAQAQGLPSSNQLPKPMAAALRQSSPGQGSIFGMTLRREAVGV